MIRQRVPGAVGTRAARRFVAASSQYLTASTGFGLGANEACFIACWARRDSTTSVQILAMLGVPGSNNNARQLYTNGANVASVAAVDNGGTATIANSVAGAFAVNTGYHSLIGEFASTTSRSIIVDGGARVTNGGTRTLTLAPTVFQVGAALNAAAAPLSGGLATVAIFAGTASDALIAAHKSGVHPTRLPGTLLECWDLDRLGPIRGVNGTWLTPTNGGSLVPGPMQVQGPARVRRVFVGAAGGTTESLTGAAATVTWGNGAGNLEAYAALSGDAAATAFVVANNELESHATLAGASPSLNWAAASGALASHASLDGVSPSVSWNASAGTFTSHVSLDGASATLSWASPAGDLTCISSMAGSSASLVWGVSAGALVDPDADSSAVVLIGMIL